MGVAEPGRQQLAYMNALAEQAGYTQESLRERLGLYEQSPWGKRLRSEYITRANVSAWINILKEEIRAAGQIPDAG